MSEKKVVRRKKTNDEKVEDIDRQIAEKENKKSKIDDEIRILMARREELTSPLSYPDIAKEARRRGVSPRMLSELLDAHFPAKTPSDKD